MGLVLEMRLSETERRESLWPLWCWEHGMSDQLVLMTVAVWIGYTSFCESYPTPCKCVSSRVCRRLGQLPGVTGTLSAGVWLLDLPSQTPSVHFSQQKPPFWALMNPFVHTFDVCVCSYVYAYMCHGSGGQRSTLCVVLRYSPHSFSRQSLSLGLGLTG